MGEHTRTSGPVAEATRTTLGELIHATVRGAIEAAVEAELAATLGAAWYGRVATRLGYRNGTKVRTLTGPTGPVALTVPRATLQTSAGPKEWASALVPRYQRRLPEVNAVSGRPIVSHRGRGSRATRGRPTRASQGHPYGATQGRP